MSFLIKALHSIRKFFRQKKNFGVVDQCGKRTILEGSIEKRGQGSIVSIGDRCLIAGLLVTEAPGSRINVGDNVLIGGGTTVAAAKSVEIESDVLISYGCVITDSDNHNIGYSLRKNDLWDWLEGRYDWNKVKTRPVKICKGAWIGAHAIITKGVTIGEGAVCGAGSVVTKSVAPYTIVAGNPARVVREIPPAKC